MSVRLQVWCLKCRSRLWSATRSCPGPNSLVQSTSQTPGDLLDRFLRLMWSTRIHLCSSLSISPTLCALLVRTYAEYWLSHAAFYWIEYFKDTIGKAMLFDAYFIFCHGTLKDVSSQGCQFSFLLFSHFTRSLLIFKLQSERLCTYWLL